MKLAAFLAPSRKAAPAAPAVRAASRPSVARRAGDTAFAHDDPDFVLGPLGPDTRFADSVLDMVDSGFLPEARQRLPESSAAGLAPRERLTAATRVRVPADAQVASAPKPIAAEAMPAPVESVVRPGTTPPAARADSADGDGRGFWAMLVLLLAGLVGCFAFGWWHAAGGASLAPAQGRSSDAIAEAQRLARVAARAASGTADAIEPLREAREGLQQTLASSTMLGASLTPAGTDAGRVHALWRKTDAQAAVVLERAPALREAGALRSRLQAVSGPMLADAETVLARKLAAATNPGELVEAGKLPGLVQKLPRELDLLLVGDVASARQAGETLAADLARAREVAGSLLVGSERLRIPATTDPRAREALQRLVGQADALVVPVQAIQPLVPAIREAREAAAQIEAEAEPLYKALRASGGEGAAPTADIAGWALWPAIGCAVLAALAAIGLVRAQMRDGRLRRERIDRQLREAERLEQDAKQANEQNQAAILRLMNELQSVADGDLTVQATVSEDITGAIADSVNYTVEELRSLVSRINATAEMVNAASSQAQMIASSLQAASEEQSREIRDTGESVLRMAQQINEVSARAAESAHVARHSLSASQDGARAVHTAIEGMNGIRDHIQETAKRIKRLGESSQEIGEIVELISDITEQTNVLALNAAIQAASAGEAGRGFTVVAEEVQQLAERSAAATRQIAGLIRTIQTDTHNAVAAMERSTQGVVEGTRQSDDAGRALDEIGRVSAHVAELIEEFSNSTSRQAASAGIVAQSIQRILLVTEQTSEGTLQTAGSIRQLADLSQELQHSVSRFKVA